MEWEDSSLSPFVQHLVQDGFLTSPHEWFVSHLTYNEYPLEVEKIAILDEEGLRSMDDYEWIRGNAEHSWGILN